MDENKLKKTYPMWISIPAFIIYSIFFILPIVGAFILSFTDWNMNRMNKPAFIGIRNFISLFNDEIFFRAVMNTFLFAFTTTLFKTVIGLILALVVVKKFWGNSFFRTLFYMPCVFSCMIVGLIFTAILKVDGLLNNLLSTFTSSAVTIDWLGSYDTAMFWIIVVEVWMWAGFSMSIFISGLQAIPKDYYECSDLEGITSWGKFKYITLPLLAPSFTVVVTLNITGGLKVFDLVYALTGGGPGFDTQVLNTYTYRAFGLGLLGKSSASALILSIIIVIITFTLNKVLKSKEVDI